MPYSDGKPTLTEQIDEDARRDFYTRDLLKEAQELEHENKRLIAALETIGGGHTERWPGVPDVMAETPESFRHKMWSWNQAVAKAAISHSP